jgi:hypothetical protein
MSSTTREITNSDDIIDLRDVIARFEELETELQDAHEGIGGDASAQPFDEWLVATIEDDSHTMQEAAQEFTLLRALIEDCKGNGGDEQWRGDWYPVGLIRDSYFEDYAREFADDIGAINSDASWPNTCIDWEKAASELQMDYSSVEFDGVTYWYR